MTKKHSRRRSRFRPCLERLETRLLLAGDFQNPVVAQDVDVNGFVAIADLIPIITHLRTYGVPHDLRTPTDPPVATPPFVDVTGDDVVALDDLLPVVALLRDGVGVPAPGLQAGLANDTGAPFDGITSDPTIEGAVSAGRLDETRVAARVDGRVLALVSFDAQGAISFSPDLPLDGTANGPHTLELIAQTSGGAPAMESIPFTLVAGLSGGLILNGSFEAGPTDADARWNSGGFMTLGHNQGGIRDIYGWTVAADGQIDLVRSDETPDGNRFVDLTGSPLVGMIEQTFATTIGHEYLVTFDISGVELGPPDTGVAMRVQVATGECAAFVSTPYEWETKQWRFTATQDLTTLQFASLHPSAGGHGPILDNVVVTELGPASNGVVYNPSPDSGHWLALPNGDF
ncbi:MAG: DUF642 domain-containing protein, partial [Planctomycetes bacterium]|nr:DUF642 domain-containing protein [Planctomycetota bacterium]